MAVKTRPIFYYYEGKRASIARWERYYVCDRCGKEIDVPSGKTKYCPECREIVKREKTAERVRKHRAKKAQGD